MADTSGAVLSRSLSKSTVPRAAVQRAAVRSSPMRSGIAQGDVMDTLRAPGRPVRGARQVVATLTALVRSARHELLTFDDPGGALGRGIPPHFLESAAAWVRMAGEPPSRDERRGSGSRGGPSQAPTVTVRRIVPRHGLVGLPYPLPTRLPGRARGTDSIPFKMIVADRAVAAVPLDLQLHYNGLLLIRDPVVVQALVRTHQAWWETGEDLASVEVPSPGVLPGQLQPVLDALLAGITDETAAARLGMSSRTYSRRVGELLGALGTTSRFRAGAEAARRGWI
jgi:hypothetical protein